LVPSAVFRLLRDSGKGDGREPGRGVATRATMTHGKLLV